MTVVFHDKQTASEARSEERAEFRALVSECGVYRLSTRSKIALTGSDRVRWLNGMVTNNIRDLAVGRGVYAFLLSPQGHILADLYAFNLGDSLLLEIEQAQKEKILATFDHYIIMDDVEVTDATEKFVAIGISGPKAQSVLQAIGLEFPDLAALQFVNLTWRQMPFTLVHSDHPCVASFELWLAPEHADSVYEELVKAGAKPAGAAATELLRIASGIPRYGQDIRERDLPQETSQDRALSFTKGCYIGQEIVERIRSRGAVHRTFTGFL